MRITLLCIALIIIYPNFSFGQLDRSQSKKRVQLESTKTKGKINQVDISKNCGDLSVKEIKYEVVSKKTERMGTVKITGVVENNSPNNFKTEKGKSKIKLVETTQNGKRTVKGVRLKELSEGQKVILEFVRKWYIDSPSPKRPTSYSVEIDHPKTKRILPIHNDCLSKNNKGTRTTIDIESLFESNNR